MRPWVILAGLSGFVAVALGAYAAHGLAGDPGAQALAERAALYHLFHTLALLAADRLAAERRRVAHGAALLFALGIVLFSGSLYFRALTGLALPVPMITPAGGLAFMGGWLAIAVAGLSRRG